MDFNKLAIQAMKEGRRIKLIYHGQERLVEAHALGLSVKGSPCVRVWQVIGGSNFSEKTGWKMLSLTDIEDAQLLDAGQPDGISQAPRPGFNPGDRGMSTILWEINDVPNIEQAQARG